MSSRPRQAALAKVVSRVAVFLFLLWWLATQSGSCFSSVQPLHLQGRTMGTWWHVTVAEPDQGVDYQTIIQDALDQVDNRMSTYKADSELSRFNRADVGTYRDFSPSSLEVIRNAIALAEQTEGAFDPTILPLIELWGFGAKEGESSPTAQQIADRKEQVGWQYLRMDESDGVVKMLPNLQLDLSATAKGFGVDQVTEALNMAGSFDFLVEVGGELRSQGFKANGVEWVVGIDRPVLDISGERSLQQVIQVGDWAVATSGDYRNYREIDGKRVSHLVDPRTGYPTTHNLASATIVAKDCITADGLATAVSILGAEQGMQLLSELPEVHGFLILRNDGKFQMLETPDFAQFKPE